MTDEISRAATGPRVRRTTVPHPQRWRSPHEAGWTEGDRLVRPARRPQPELPAASPFGRPVRRFRKVVVSSATPADGAAWEAAKRVELEIFAIRNGWATEASVAAGEVLDYAPHAARSEIFVAAHQRDLSVPVGVARMIWGTSAMSLDEQFVVTAMHRIEPEWRWMLGTIGLDHVAEWATLGAIGSNLSPMFALWSTAYRAARARRVDYWVQSIVESLFSGYRDGFGMPMMQIGDREVVVGAESIPTVVLLDEAGIGRMIDWDPALKREMFGAWVDRRSHLPDPNDLGPFVR